MDISKTIGFEGVYTEKMSYNNLINNIVPPDCKIEVIGYSEDNEYPLYGVSYGDISHENVLFLISSMHSDNEWASIHSDYQFIYALSRPNEFPNQKEELELIKRHFKGVYWIVCANPWGYVNVNRRNKNGVSIGGDFDSGANEQQETTAIKNKIIEVKPSLLIDHHEKQSPGLGVAGVNLNNSIDSDYRWRIFRAMDWLSHLANEFTHYHGSYGGAGSGEVRSWVATNVLSKTGKQIPGMIIEGGDNSVSNERIRLRTKRGINAVFALVLSFLPLPEEHKVFIMNE